MNTMVALYKVQISPVAIARTPMKLAPSGYIDAGFLTYVIGWWRTYTDWRARRIAISQLANMSDYELKDIGLNRDQIEAGVRGDLASDTTLKNRMKPCIRRPNATKEWTLAA